MSLVRCNGCEQRVQDKPLSVYWAWRLADGSRRAYKSRLCTACFVSRVSPLDIDYTTVERLTCPNCGIDTEDDHDSIWATSYIPRYGAREVEAPFCNACAAHMRLWVQEHAEALEDRLGATGGPQPSASGLEVLAALGIQAREN